MLCQTCLVSRYSSRPASPSSRPDAGLLVAAPLGLRHVRVVVVDPHGAHAQPVRDPLAPCRRPGSRPRRPARRCCRWRSRPPRPRRVNVSTVSTGPNDSSGVTVMPTRAAVEDGRQVVEAVGERGVVGAARRRTAARRPRRGRRATYASTFSRWAALMSGPVSALWSNGPPRRIEPARSTSRSTNWSWISPRPAAARRPSRPGRSAGTPPSGRSPGRPRGRRRRRRCWGSCRRARARPS